MNLHYTISHYSDVGSESRPFRLVETGFKFEFVSVSFFYHRFAKKIQVSEKLLRLVDLPSAVSRLMTSKTNPKFKFTICFYSVGKFLVQEVD